MEFKNLKVERRDGGAVVLTIARPERLNALNAEVMRELGAALDGLIADAATRGIVLTGAGEKAFVAGADIAELAPATPLVAREIGIFGQRVLEKIERSPKPVIAAVNGFALGGGCELALACHVRIASENARLGTPEVKLGLMCGYGGTQRLPRLVGRGRALEMLLTGEMIDAQEAFRIGLVNRVVPKDRLLDEALALLGKMTANAPRSIEYTLAAVDQGLDLPLEQGLRYEATFFAVLASTDDKNEGTRAFLEKRPPQFTGR